MPHDELLRQIAEMTERLPDEEFHRLMEFFNAEYRTWLQRAAKLAALTLRPGDWWRRFSRVATSHAGREAGRSISPDPAFTSTLPSGDLGLATAGSQETRVKPRRGRGSTGLPPRALNSYVSSSFGSTSESR